MRLAEVSRFEFGESYLLVVGSLTTDYPELDDLLELMGDMFRLEASTYVPSVSVKVYKRPIGFGPNVRGRATLRVAPSILGLPAPDNWIEGIRKRVTHYNLSGNWDYFETENL